MNWNKGAKTKGRGTSFKGALKYYLHDKDKAVTSERVGFVELLNLVTDNPHDAWREMMATAEAAPELKRRHREKLLPADASDELKRRARASTGGQKNTRPVYAFSIQWHPDDHPTKEHMRQTALDVLRTLKLHEHQAVLVEHTDEPHPHVHICVNLRNPETGLIAKLSKDHYILERWADTYELKMGLIRSPERRAKFAALDAGLKPAPKPKTPKRFQEPDTKAANDDIPMRDRAAAIRDQQRAYAARLKATQDESWKRRKNEHRALWNDYRTARQAIRARHQFQIDQIYKHKRNRAALPLSIQGFRDWKETREWKALMARLKADRRRFEYRERTLLGFVGNAIALLRPGMRRTGRGLLPMLFNLLVSGKARRKIMASRHALATRALSDKQFGKRQVRAERVKVLRDAQMQALAVAFDIQKAALDQRHEQEIATQKQGWRDLAKQRKELWDQWREEFGVRQRQRETARAGSGGDSRGRTAAAPKLQTQFPGAPKPARPNQSIDAGVTAKKKPPKVTEKFLGAGKPVTKPKPPDPRPSVEFAPAASKDTPQPKPGYKQRRSAAERRAEGSYKPRQRDVPKPKP
jgi:Relaxase/Mobilisation nuclease domain